MRYLNGFIVALLLVFGSAEAQTVDAGFERMIGGIISGTAGETVSADGNGVTVRGNHSKEHNTPNGKVTTSARASSLVPKGSVAAAARAGVRALGPLGLAATGYDLYNAIKDSGLSTCPPPYFFCKPAEGAMPETTPQKYYVTKDLGSTKYHSEEATCKAYATYLDSAQPAYAPFVYQSYTTDDPHFYCKIEHKWGDPPRMVSSYGPVTRYTGCPDNYVLGDDGLCHYTGTNPEGEPYTDAELEQALLDKINTDFFYGKKYYDAMQADKKRNSSFMEDTNLVPPDTAVEVLTEPQATPEQETSRRVIQNADGTTSTVTERQRTTVTPQPSGNTLSNTYITYNITTTTTTTTVNNTTGETTTETEEKKETPNPCDENPELASCAELGEAPQQEEIPEQVIDASYSPISFASSASCPSPISFDLGPYGGSKAISWQPFCDTLATLRAIFLSLAAAAVAFIYMRGIQTL
jgi:hypothetical protein